MLFPVLQHPAGCTSRKACPECLFHLHLHSWIPWHTKILQDFVHCDLCLELEDVNVAVNEKLKDFWMPGDPRVQQVQEAFRAGSAAGAASRAPAAPLPAA